MGVRFFPNFGFVLQENILPYPAIPAATYTFPAYRLHPNAKSTTVYLNKWPFPGLFFFSASVVRVVAARGLRYWEKVHCANKLGKCGFPILY